MCCLRQHVFEVILMLAVPLMHIGKESVIQVGCRGYRGREGSEKKC